MKSPLFSYFKVCYSNGTSTITTKETLRNAVTKSYITEPEFEDITGDKYAASAL